MGQICKLIACGKKNHCPALVCTVLGEQNGHL